MTNKLSKISAILLVSWAGFSCSDWDDFLEYTQDGEIIYPGKVKNIYIYPGDSRVLVTGALGPDPKVDSYRIYWNDFADSVEIDASEAAKPSDFQHLIPVEEGVRTFVLYTYDDSGNRSIPVSVVGTSYGENYRKKMSDRQITSITVNPSTVTINWAQMDITVGAQFTEITYQVDGEPVTVQTPVTESVTVLDGLVESQLIQYTTVFRPEPSCIDLFYTAAKTYQINR